MVKVYRYKSKGFNLLEKLSRLATTEKQDEEVVLCKVDEMLQRKKTMF